jgi:type I restriction enzyme R subunit
MSVALGNRDDDTLTSLAGRLSRMERELDDIERREIESAVGGRSLKEIINGLLDAVDPDKKETTAKELFQTETPTKEQLKKAEEELKKASCSIFDLADLRNKLIEIKQRDEQIIDTISRDKATFAGFDGQAREKAAKSIIDRFRKFIGDNKDELTALQIIYNKPYGTRHLTYEQIKSLAEALRKPPYNLTPENIWHAYEQLEKSKVKGAGPQRLLTNIVALVRYAIGEVDTLEPFHETVNRRYRNWLTEQEKAGQKFTSEQAEWLTMIKDHIATSLKIGIDDFENVPFNQKGGAISADRIFGKELPQILERLNTVLVA